MRVALAYPEVGDTTSLGRETLMIANALIDRGSEVHIYQRPSPARPGLVQHAVGEPTASGRSARVGQAVDAWRWARAANHALAGDRTAYDVVCAVGTAGWVHDLVRVHAVIRAEQQRWPVRGGREFRAARPRAALAPMLRPQIAVERTIQRLQFRPGRFVRALAVTDEVAHDLVEQFGADPSRIDVVPCLIDYARFAAVPQRSEALVNGDHAFVFIGNDFERKGLSIAIRALTDLPSNVHLIVVGGDDPAPFRKLATELNVGSRVAFEGASPAPERFYLGATALVSPSAEDVWGMALIEAMAAGVPVISSSSAGAASLVADSQAGIVLDELSPRALARAIEQIVDDPAQAAQMGADGRRAAADFHHATVRRLVEAFEAPRAATQTRT